ncbi:MAG: hypothetical protein COT43_04970, partial [Candidatus Marinimicrobia bacterium CG08_land_8_20_14_0_20_45_22]
YTGVYIKSAIKDIYGIEQFGETYSQPFTVDNTKPAVSAASYEHGNENFTFGSSAEFSVFCNKDIDAIDYSGIKISTADLFSISGGTNIATVSITQTEFDAGISSSVLYFNLSSSTWRLLAQWSRDSSQLFLCISTGALKDVVGNAIGESSLEINWKKDTKYPLISGPLYKQNEDDVGKPSGVRIQFDEEIGGWASDIKDKLYFYTSKTGVETPINFEDGLTISSESASIFWFYPAEEKHIQIINLGVTKLYLACGEIGYDLSGNYVRSIPQADGVFTPLTKETSAPWIYDYSPSPLARVSPYNPDIWVKFSELMYSPTINNQSVYLTAVKNNKGETIYESVPAYILYFSSSQVVKVIPFERLDYGYRYRLSVLTDISDLSLNYLLMPWNLEFETLYDLSSSFSLSTGPITIAISANAVQGSGRIEVRLDDSNDSIKAAYEREKLFNDDAHHRIIGGAVTLEIYDSSDTLMTGNFANDVTISF